MLDAALRLIADEKIYRVGGPGVTVAGWMAKWLDDRELARTHRSVDNDRSRFKTHIESDPIGSVALCEVRRVHVVDWLDRMLTKAPTMPNGSRPPPRGTRLSRSTIQRALNLLRVALEDALDRELIGDNPSRSVRVPKGVGVRAEEPWTYLHPHEQTALLRAVPEDERDLVAFAMGAGLRQGEQWALQVRNVNLERRRIAISRGSKTGPRKSGKVAHAALFGMALEAITTQLMKRPRRPDALVFPGPQGGQRAEGAPRRFAAWVAAAGIERHVRWHDLRHTCASSLVAGWWGHRWTIEEVAAQLGHTDSSMTRRYAHLAPSALDESARRTLGLPT